MNVKKILLFAAVCLVSCVAPAPEQTERIEVYNSWFNGCLGISCSSTKEDGVTYPSDSKYYNLYTTSANYTSSGLQHALSETLGWYGDYAYFVPGNYPWFERGGRYDFSSNAGVFDFSASNGDSYGYYGFRSALVK